MAYKFLDMLTTNSVREAQSEIGVREQWGDFRGNRQYIVPRFTKDIVDLAGKPLQEEIARLTAENQVLKESLV
ncbi:MAG: hypothetical protein ABJO01_01255 [Parasphingorhabdus sp.]|uniref:hypothetical protein n=1 Tax=Parasphingorhabdus sp. TaxID=2709688 RepID=UPI00329A48E7